jgi:hypothetical protein
MPGDLMRAPEVLWRRTLRGVLLRPPRGAAVMIDGSGGLVWDALASPTSVEDLVDRLAAATGGDRSVIAADVRPLLDRLRGLGAVVDSP